MNFIFNCNNNKKPTKKNIYNGISKYKLYIYHKYIIKAKYQSIIL